MTKRWHHNKLNVNPSKIYFPKNGIVMGMLSEFRISSRWDYLKYVQIRLQKSTAEMKANLQIKAYKKEATTEISLFCFLILQWIKFVVEMFAYKNFYWEGIQDFLTGKIDKLLILTWSSFSCFISKLVNQCSL